MKKKESKIWTVLLIILTAIWASMIIYIDFAAITAKPHALSVTK